MGRQSNVKVVGWDFELEVLKDNTRAICDGDLQVIVW